MTSPRSVLPPQGAWYRDALEAPSPQPACDCVTGKPPFCPTCVQVIVEHKRAGRALELVAGDAPPDLRLAAASRLGAAIDALVQRKRIRHANRTAARGNRGTGRGRGGQ